MQSSSGISVNMWSYTSVTAPAPKTVLSYQEEQDLMSRYAQELLKPQEFGPDRKTDVLWSFFRISLTTCLLSIVGSQVAEFRLAAFPSSFVPLLIVSYRLVRTSIE